MVPEFSIASGEILLSFQRKIVVVKKFSIYCCPDIL